MAKHNTPQISTSVKIEKYKNEWVYLLKEPI